MSSLLKTVRAVAWSFIGIRKRSGYEEDSATLSPLHIVAVGIVGAALFVVALIFLVKWVVAT